MNVAQSIARIRIAQQDGWINEDQANEMVQEVYASVECIRKDCERTREVASKYCPQCMDEVSEALFRR